MDKMQTILSKPVLQRKDSGYDTWNTPRLAHAFVRMAESGRVKVKELLARHSELEQSETKAQAALITVLSLTQITELKLLLDIGREGHRFYDFVLAMLIACISLELFIGIIIIYIGNLHYYQTTDRVGFCQQLFNCFLCNAASSYAGKARRPRYTGMTRASTLRREAAMEEDVELTESCCKVGGGNSRLEAMIDLERADCNIELARVRVADGNLKIARSANYIKVVEEALKKSPGSVELTSELQRAKDDHTNALREKEEAEAELKLAEAQQNHAFFMKEQEEDRQERLTFRKISFWQHLATYLLYFVMLLNVFITTFGISTGVSYHDNPNIPAPQALQNTFSYHPSAHVYQSKESGPSLVNFTTNV